MTHEELKRITDFFEKNHEVMINSWLGRVRLDQEDPFYHEVVNNLRNTARMITVYIGYPNHQHIERITEKVVRERIVANTNLDEIVNGINIGREIVLEAVVGSGFSESVRSVLFLEVSRFFDFYLYHTIKTYTERKEAIIHDKNRFIRKMHTDRLTILGQTAASFAHEFRNPLTAIKGFLTLLEKRGKSDEKTEYYLSIIQREMKSLEEKVTGFLDLSKREGLEDRKTLIDLGPLLRETVEFLYPRFSSEGIEMSIKMAPEKMAVFGIRDQLKQVFLNIINNAVEELSYKPGDKQIILSTELCGDKIRISIANNGSPVEPGILENIFDPFVTTKEKGTGLGLSVCKQIIEKHGGALTVSSDEKLTVFLIELKQESCLTGKK